MMNLFLRAKHWQLFIGLIVIPLLVHITVVSSILGKVFQTDNPIYIFSMMRWMPVVVGLFLIGNFGWMWSVGVGLQRKLPSGVKMKVNFFKGAILFISGYMIVFFVFLNYLFDTIMIGQTQNNIPHFSPDPTPFYFIPVLLIMHLFSIFCMFYIFYFNARTVKSIELGREAKMSEYIGYVFLFWLNFVGLWIIQPIINKIQTHEDVNSSNELLDSV